MGDPRLATIPQCGNLTKPSLRKGTESVRFDPTIAEQKPAMRSFGSVPGFGAGTKHANLRIPEIWI